MHGTPTNDTNTIALTPQQNYTPKSTVRTAQHHQTSHQISHENPIHSGIDIVLDHSNATYKKSQIIQGTLLIAAKDGWKHPEIHVKLLATLNIKHPGSSSKGADIQILQELIPVKVRGYLSPGLHRLAFRVPLIERHNKQLLESIRGDCINVTYALEVELDRGIFQRLLKRRVEFLLHVPLNTHQIQEMELDQPDPAPFIITPTSLGRNVQKGAEHTVPNFLFRGKLHRKSIAFPSEDDEEQYTHEHSMSTVHSNQHVPPISGEFVVELCEVSIQSIDMQLMRVESLYHSQQQQQQQQHGVSSYSNMECLLRTTCTQHNVYNNNKDDDISVVYRRVREVQVLQIADGDVCRNLVIPIYMVLPKLCTCQTMVCQGYLRWSMS